MPSARANEIQIEYETFGESGSSPLLLIMGLGGQLIRWPEVFCQELADRGHYVIRFDNRDTGLSSKIDEAGVPNIMEIITASLRGDEIVRVGYLKYVKPSGDRRLDVSNETEFPSYTIVIGTVLNITSLDIQK